MRLQQPPTASVDAPDIGGQADGLGAGADLCLHQCQQRRPDALPAHVWMHVALELHQMLALREAVERGDESAIWRGDEQAVIGRMVGRLPDAPQGMRVGIGGAQIE
jgi:hypothetical protein